ncbi:hypothetical protein TYRP_014531 [Tyrophagus putrescentiae]|nr:hypothetical protein TYRP_014531 [Tyrophagus putrescentiae]
MDSDDDLQMTFFKKKKKNHDAVNNFNDNVGKKVQHQSDQPKMIHSKVHKKKDRKNLLAFMCKFDFTNSRFLAIVTKSDVLDKLLNDSEIVFGATCHLVWFQCFHQLVDLLQHLLVLLDLLRSGIANIVRQRRNELNK